VPVYNEAEHLAQVVQALMEKAKTLPVQCEWIFVDDFSNDASLTVLKTLQRQYDFKIIVQENNQGKGAAVIRGIEAASGDFIVIQDADFEYDLSDVARLLEPLIEQRADVVYGNRFGEGSFQAHWTWHYFANRILTILSNLLSGIHLSDMETCYKVFRAELLKSMRLQSKRFGVEVELTAYLAKVSIRIQELPISYHPRTRRQGKKITWKDGFAALWHLFRFNWFTSVEQAYGLKESRPRASDS